MSRYKLLRDGIMIIGVSGLITYIVVVIDALIKDISLMMFIK